METHDDRRAGGAGAEKTSNGAVSPFGSFINSMNSSMNDFNENPQLGKIVQNFEIRHDNSMARQFGKKTPYALKPEIFRLGVHESKADADNEKVRSRKFKKPMNTLASRRDRIEMVKGLCYDAEAETAAA